MRYSQYAVLDNGSVSTNNGIGPSTILGPTLIGTPSDGYLVPADYTFNSRPIDLGNVNHFGALCTFFTGSTLAGTLTLQVSDDDSGPTSLTGPNTSYPCQPSWLTLTTSNVWGGSNQVVGSVSVTSGAVVVPFEYSQPGHRWLRFVWTASSGTGTVSFAYTLKSR